MSRHVMSSSIYNVFVGAQGRTSRTIQCRHIGMRLGTSGELKPPNGGLKPPRYALAVDLFPDEPQRWIEASQRCLSFIAAKNKAVQSDLVQLDHLHTQTHIVEVGNLQSILIGFVYCADFSLSGGCFPICLSISLQLLCNLI